jgi:periplasmic divalent cation tolerance protein
MRVVLTTTSSAEEAKSLARAIVEAKLAACVQILPEMESIYYWEGKVLQEAEHLLLIKTIPSRYDELEKFILEQHSYDTPEIVALDAERVSDGYLKWLKAYVG